MRILILGGTGFMGPHAVTELHDQGHEVTVFHRSKRDGNLPSSVRHIHHPDRGLGDRSHFADFVTDFKRLAPNVVLDMTAMTAQDAWATMQTFRGIAGRIVVASSCDVYRAYDRLRGQTPGTQGDSTERPAPMKWMDDYDKILVERIVLSETIIGTELPGTVVRLPAVYGPRDGQHRLFPHLKRMLDNRPAILLGEAQARWRWTHGYVENMGHALALAVTDNRAAGRVYNVGEADPLAEGDWVRAIAQEAGWAGEVITVSDDRLPAHLQSGDTHFEHHLVVDTARIRDELGYTEVVPFAEGVRRAIAWESENPPPQVDEGQYDYGAEDALLAQL